MTILSKLGLMRVSEHERQMRDAAFGTMTVEVHKDLIAVERAKYKRAVTDLAAQADEIAALLDAGKDVISTASDHYTARNNRRMTIQGDDGEKCWIVPFDQFEHLRHTLDRINDQRDRDMKAAKRGNV